ncbi:hypothetical protein [Bauldia litoralis]|uniref:Nutrient deprivation-induced protein n=1 Tax=Bauldia litoralis TaxID=665467 RepID=A0A1G6EMU7_9HYPH|nr:hypothetical protein [Bauldia litoralis]SDB58748.1 hypothetical protein SAMN02982931_04726 [Bauldia litoralis]
MHKATSLPSSRKPPRPPLSWADEAKKQVGEIEAKAETFAGEQKDAAAERLVGIAAALKDVAGDLDNRDEPAVAGYARDLAKGIGRVSDTIKDRDVGDLMAMAEDFGRKQPAAFLGLAALAGFASGRFALASAAKRERDTPRSVSSRQVVASSPGPAQSAPPRPSPRRPRDAGHS